MPRILFDDFKGGRNTLDSVNKIKNNQSPDAENCWVENNALTQRRGFTSTAITISSLSVIPQQLAATQLAASSLLRLAFIGRVTAHSQRYLGYTDNGSSFSFAAYRAGTCSTAGSSTTITGASTAWANNVAVGDYFIPSGGAANRITAVNSDTDITVTTAVNLGAGTAYQIIQKITQNTRPAAMALFDVSGAQNLYITDGARSYRYDGTDVFRTDTTDSMPAGYILVPFKNYLFILGHNNTDIRWCDLKDPTSWPSANAQTITNVGDPIRGAIVYADSIVIFTRGKMYRFMGDVFDPSNATYVLESIAVPSDFSFTYSRSPVIHQGILKFLATDGFYAYTGGTQITKISKNIQGDIDGFRRLAFATEVMNDGAVGYVWKDRAWWAVPDDAETPQQQLNTIVMQDERGGWWKWPTAEYSAAGSFSDFAIARFGTSGSYQLMAGCIQTNQISVLDSGNQDNGGVSATQIVMLYTTEEVVFDKEVEFVRFFVKMKKQSSGDITVGFSIDRVAFVSKTIDMDEGVGTVIIKSAPIARMGKAIRMRITSTTINVAVEVYSIEVECNNTIAERI